MTRPFRILSIDTSGGSGWAMGLAALTSLATLGAPVAFAQTQTAEPSARAATATSPAADTTAPPPANRAPAELGTGEVALPLTWPAHARRRPGYLELGLGTGLAVVAITLPIFSTPDDAHWTGGILMDGWVRGRLHLGAAGRTRAAKASDGLLYSTLSIPFLELAIGTLAGRVSGDLLLRMTLVSLQAFGITGFVTSVAKVTAARERPYGRRCASTPDDPECSSSARYVSFFSGHTSLTFTAAGLSCVMHQHLHLYGRRALDAGACGLALAAAAATGVMRVVGDQHWTTDSLVGASVGLLSGWLMPYLLYFRGTSAREANEDASGLPSAGLTSGVFSPWASARGAGLSYGAIF